MVGWCSMGTFNDPWRLSLKLCISKTFLVFEPLAIQRFATIRWFGKAWSFALVEVWLNASSTWCLGVEWIMLGDVAMWFGNKSKIRSRSKVNDLGMKHRNKSNPDRWCDCGFSQQSEKNLDTVGSMIFPAKRVWFVWLLVVIDVMDKLPKLSCTSILVHRFFPFPFGFFYRYIDIYIYSIYTIYIYILHILYIVYIYI